MSKNLSAVKKAQIALRNKLKNKSYKSSIKTSIKKTVYSINQISSEEQIKNNISKTYSIIDKAVKKGVITKNKGSRKKSKLIARYKQIILS